MPWTQTDPVIERQKFVRLVLKGQVTMTEACQQFGISRKTGYKILERHAEHGMTGLADASRAPKTHPNQSPPEVEAAVLRVRKAHPTWGSKKILATLDRERPGEDWPARSTVDAILKRDYPIIQGVMIIFAGVYVLINLAIDITYCFIDPRIRYT